MICKNGKCGKELTDKLPLSFGNRIARLKGYCLWICMSEHLGKENAFKMLQNEQNKGNTGRAVEIRAESPGQKL